MKSFFYWKNSEVFWGRWCLLLCLNEKKRMKRSSNKRSRENISKFFIGVGNERSATPSVDLSSVTAPTLKILYQMIRYHLIQLAQYHGRMHRARKYPKRINPDKSKTNTKTKWIKCSNWSWKGQIIYFFTKSATLDFILRKIEKNLNHVKKVSWATIMEIILLDFLMFYKIFLSPQVKQSAIISNKQGVYELPHELPNEIRKNQENL